MREPLTCPDEQVLGRLVLGQLPGEEAETLAQHLEECDHCASAVPAALTPDTLVEASRVSPATQTDPVVQSLIERFLALPLLTTTDDARPDRALDVRTMLAPAQEPGELGRLGTYRVLKVLGTGGMGVVFEAEDLSLRRPVALKVINPAFAALPTARERFLREARAVAAVCHDHVIAVYQAGEDRGVLFMAMPLLQGETLEQRLRRNEVAGTLTPLPEVVRVASEAAQGLAAAHAQGLIHRDIKPSNLWLEQDGRVKLLDFGLARAVAGEAALTAPGLVAGTPAYLAPELLHGVPTDARGDLFSLGCVLYRMLTGFAPFQGEDKVSTLKAIASVTPTAPRTLNPAVPLALSALVLRLLARNPAERPASASEVVKLLRQTEASDVRRRSYSFLGLASVCFFVLLGGVAGVLHLSTNKGVFILEIDDPALAVQVNAQGGVTLRDPTANRTYTLAVGKHDLPTGEYDLEVKDSTGLEFSTRRFTLKRGGEVKVTASLLKKDGTPAASPFESWITHVASLPANEQVAAVVAKLQELNPGFDGNVGTRIENGIVVELRLVTDHLSNLSPLRAFRDLEMLTCHGSESAKGGLSDLSPLRGMKLVYLDCSANPHLKDLSPLRGMPLRELACWCTPVVDLRPLRGMALTMIDLNWCYVTDFSPLAGMPLLRFNARSNFAAPDPALLASLPLRELALEYQHERHARVLWTLPTLERINEQPVPQFRKLAEARQADLEAFLQRVPTLSPDDQVTAVTAKLREYNPEFRGRVFSKTDSEAVLELQFFADGVRDLRPVAALTRLQRLRCDGTVRFRSTLFDLTPIRNLPLNHLDCSRTYVSDLSPLKEMRLGALVCAETFVQDLSPLHGRPLIYLDCSQTKVADLKPLRGMGLLHLRLMGSKVTDLSPLQKIPLCHLTCDTPSERDAAMLRAMTSIKTINDLQTEEFWRRRDAPPAGRFP